ncbi:hypothetical protein HHI36_016374 [Cryptolaemus montrouzieri]|uniref:Uncharacterized protein n=1 Tax=Cryptolaemus montrouzieri TaxID=559131 RepID=A0ABD2NJX8_9CUCU
MVMRMRCEPGDAIAKFHKARGYEMYRQNFIAEILTPGLHADKSQRPDYKRHSNTVRPVHNHDNYYNWRERISDVPEADQTWTIVNRRRRQNYRQNFPPPQTYRDFRRRHMGYRSPLDFNYEDNHGRRRYGEGRNRWP